MPVTAQTIAHMQRMVLDLEALTDGHRKELLSAYVNAWDTVVGQLTDALTQLATEPLTAARVQRSSKVASALQAIADELDSLASLTGVVISDGAGHAVSVAAEAQAAIVGSQLPSVGVHLVDVNPDIVGTIVHRTATNIVSRSRPLSEASQIAVRQALIRGAAASDNPVKVARDMVRLARAGFMNEGDTGLSLQRAEAISRTELADAARQVTEAWGNANADTLQGWQWLSSRSSNTCPACWSQDGTIHDLSEPGPYGHVRCACTRMLLTKSWRDLGIDLPEQPGLNRPPAEQFFWSMSKADQLQVMGPARLKALDDGASWSSLSILKPNADWRPSWQMTPVRDLMRA